MSYLNNSELSSIRELKKMPKPDLENPKILEKSAAIPTDEFNKNVKLISDKNAQKESDKSKSVNYGGVDFLFEEIEREIPDISIGEKRGRGRPRLDREKSSTKRMSISINKFLLAKIQKIKKPENWPFKQFGLARKIGLMFESYEGRIKEINVLRDEIRKFDQLLKKVESNDLEIIHKNLELKTQAKQILTYKNLTFLRDSLLDYYFSSFEMRTLKFIERVYGR